ncbi:MAG TPA: hypothetical protein VM577_01505, partial [Anaerovoracaceae bacterium]|nr:hypothetical protein [Anaerovoracaceae bacterium]
MKKLIPIIVLILFCTNISLTSCGSNQASDNADQTVSETNNSNAIPLSDIEIQQMYSDPDAFEGREVTLTGVVFAQVERDDEAVYFQMNQDIENYDNNTVVAYQDPGFELSDGDYVRLTGIVKGAFEGENAFGGTVTAPQILADKCEVVDYKEAVVPTVKEITVDQTHDQYGYLVTVEKVELAEKETRVYVNVTNNGGSNFSLYGFNCNLLQDSSQYDYQTN